MKKAKSRIVVAMSGGVDSSVSAALLVEQGYEVIGIMLRLWSEPGQATSRDNRCCTRDQMLDAHFVARRLGIPFHVIDARAAFKQHIVDTFIAAYNRGLTPNPCLACNRHIRFTHLLDEAIARGATHLATGHYARVERAPDGIYHLLRGADPLKDQSYVLSMLTQQQLRHALFPVGDYTKSQVRELARRFGLPVASKHESQDLCFVADGDYRRFLNTHSPAAARPGRIINRAGQVIGQHHGLSHYTIGQRKGLGISWTEPLYVLDISPSDNTLIVGPLTELGNDHFAVGSVNWIASGPPEGPIRAAVKIRYKADAAPALVTPVGPAQAEVQLDQPLRDITAGQGAVFYADERVLGGGIINRSS